VLLVGKNGSGKSTVALALKIFQTIARGTSRVGDLVKPKDLARGRKEVPMRFEIAVELDDKVYEYSIAFELPEDFKELRVREEKLIADGVPIYTRELAQVHLVRSNQSKEAEFRIDWHVIALPIVQQRSDGDPLVRFKEWLARMLILKPIPSLIRGESDHETLYPNNELTNFGAWFSHIVISFPPTYSRIAGYLEQLMPDLKAINNPGVGKDSRSLVVDFFDNQQNSNGQKPLTLPFEDLSDGEKCFIICALVLAANSAYGPLLCFWDEPDNYLALSEVGHFVITLRASFQQGGQFIATSHNEQAIRSFSKDNTFVLSRRSHLEPTIVRPLSEVPVIGDLVDALIRDDVS